MAFWRWFSFSRLVGYVNSLEGKPLFQDPGFKHLEYSELRIQYCFAGFFVVELLMRIIADGKHFFCGEDALVIRKKPDLLPVISTHMLHVWYINLHLYTFTIYLNRM